MARALVVARQAILSRTIGVNQNTAVETWGLKLPAERPHNSEATTKKGLFNEALDPPKDMRELHAYLNWWCSLELRILEENLSASFSRFLEYSNSISAFLRKNSWRSCRSCNRDSDCCSKHLNCSTNWVRISGSTKLGGGGRKHYRTSLSRVRKRTDFISSIILLANFILLYQLHYEAWINRIPKEMDVSIC